MQPVVQMRDVWTIEDLFELDVEDWRRYEIVDGALVVSPTPGLSHEYLLARVRNALIRAAPAGIEVLAGNTGVEFGRSYRVPDIAVVPLDLPGPLMTPKDVLLAVEVVSPGSVTTDRITKPAQYAAAGIPNFWRVEQDPVSLTAYRLVGDVYAEVGTWNVGETARLSDPFPVEIEISRSAP